MSLIEAQEEYALALRAGQKEYKDLCAREEDPYPAVLDDLIDENVKESSVDVGLVEIPTELIVGTVSAGRTTAFTAGFMPLLSEETEFAHKWMELCAAHLSDEGIRDPIICYEYLGQFYVQEGNKRVSVLKHFGAPRIPGNVQRILPGESDEPRIKAYYEFLEFYQGAQLYSIRFRTPGSYTKLLAYLGKDLGEPWSERERKTFRAYFQYFKDAYATLRKGPQDLRPEEALLFWLKIHPFQELGILSDAELKKSIAQLREDLLAMARDNPVQLQTGPSPETKNNLLSMLIPSTPTHLNVAFIHQADPATSSWTTGHELGAQYLRDTMADQVTVRTYSHADNQELAEQMLERAVDMGAQVVFTTTPLLARATLKMAVEFPKIKFLNCSMNAPYSSLRTYYSRIYEAKFITGAIAGAVAKNNNIGYIGSYPIFGVAASINAFALGAQMTNPQAKIHLRWSCVEGNWVQEFVDNGIRVISNRDVPAADPMFLEYGDFGTYQVEEDGSTRHLGSPCWMWGKFYAHVISSILGGTWDAGKESGQAVNYWWGMDSGVIDVLLSEHLPEGLRHLAQILRQGLQSGQIDPFRRRIVAQDGSVKNPGNLTFTAEELMRMDWLCENVEGFIPGYDQVILPARAMVRELGLFREQAPVLKEGWL